jgi:hypothetical protein
MTTPAVRPFLLTTQGQRSTFQGRLRAILWVSTSGVLNSELALTDNPALVPAGQGVAVLHIDIGGQANIGKAVVYPGAGLAVPWGLEVSQLAAGKVLLVPVDA